MSEVMKGIIGDLMLEQTEGINPILTVEHATLNVEEESTSALEMSARTAQDAIDHVLSGDLFG